MSSIHSKLLAKSWMRAMSSKSLSRGQRDATSQLLIGQKAGQQDRVPIEHLKCDVIRK